MPAVKCCFQPQPNYLMDVLRNHARILNHRTLIEEKMEIGMSLGLLQNHAFPETVVKENNDILDQLQRGSLQTSEALKKIFENVRRGSKPLSEVKFYEYLDRLIPAGHIELHPTDVCDHKCVGCYYYQKGTDVMPFEYIEKILKIYRPKSVVLVGGGEPTLYRHKDRRFEDIVFELKRLDPGIQIGLVTKGTYIPPGDWQKHIDWVRVSIDSATPEIFFKGKQVDAFDKVLHNFFEYLKGPIPHVGLGYLVWSGNIHETHALPKLVHGLMKKRCPDLIRKSNIQYRPMRPGADHPEKVKKGHISAEMISTPEQVRAAVQSFDEMMENDPEMKAYLLDHTNWYKVAEGNGVREGKSFDHCYYTLAFKMFRPTGEVYSCFARVSDPEYLFGNYMNESKEELYKINLLPFLLYNRKRDYCHGDYCRIAWLNSVAEQGLKGQIPMPTGDAARSHFF